MKFTKIALAVCVAASSFAAIAADNIKIAVIDPLSGPFANVGAIFVNFMGISSN